MNKPDRSRALLDEVFDGVDEGYKSLTPETIAIRADVLEGALYRYVVLLASLNACIVGLLMLVRESKLSYWQSVVIALACAGVTGVLARRSQESEWWPRALLFGSSLVFTLFVAAAPGGIGSIVLMTAAAVAVIGLVKARVVPEGAAVLFAIYVPLVLVAFSRHGVGERALIEALMLAPMILTFAWRKFKIAAAGSVIGAVVAGLFELVILDERQMATIALLGVFVVTGVIYELRTRLNQNFEGRESQEGEEFIRLGVAVALVYLFIASAVPFESWWSTRKLQWWSQRLSFVCMNCFVLGGNGLRSHRAWPGRP